VLAQEEAIILNDNVIRPQHLLIALIDEEYGVAASVLRSFGLTADIVRSAHPAGSGMLPAYLPFALETKKILENSLRQALMLGDNYISTEHILLAMSHDEYFVASNISAEAIKKGVMDIRMSGAAPTEGGYGFREMMDRVKSKQRNVLETEELVHYVVELSHPILRAARHYMFLCCQSNRTSFEKIP
jgi:ATP-dependent Clp protease ATP-binding subunit ClpA